MRACNTMASNIGHREHLHLSLMQPVPSILQRLPTVHDTISQDESVGEASASGSQRPSHRRGHDTLSRPCFSAPPTGICIVPRVWHATLCDTFFLVEFNRYRRRKLGKTLVSFVDKIWPSLRIIDLFANLFVDSFFVQLLFYLLSQSSLITTRDENLGKSLCRLLTRSDRVWELSIYLPIILLISFINFSRQILLGIFISIFALISRFAAHFTFQKIRKCISRCSYLHLIHAYSHIF